MNIKLDESHSDPKDCQLIICLTGSREFIESRMAELNQRLRWRGRGKEKPSQGVFLENSGIEQIITPVWDGKQY